MKGANRVEEGVTEEVFEDADEDEFENDWMYW